MKKPLFSNLLWLFALAVALMGGNAQAQAYPARPIKFIAALGPGSGTDTVTRYFAEKVGQVLHQSVVVDNRPGGDGIIAVQALLAAPPDGYTALIVAPSSAVMNPMLKRDLAYDFKRDIRPLVLIGRGAFLFVTNPKSPHQSLKDLVANAKAAPKSVNVGNYAQQYHLSAALFEQMAGVLFNHIPYKTPGPLITDLVSGTTEVGLVDVAAALPLIRAGKLRPLAVTGVTRNADLPAVPTVKESGFPDYQVYGWIGLGVRTGTPEAVVKALETAIMEVAAQPATQEFLTNNGRQEVIGAGSERFTEWIASETAKYAAVVKVLGLTPQ